MNRLAILAICAMGLASIVVAIPATDSAEANEATKKKLETRIPKADFVSIELKDVIEFLRDASGANMHVNWNALRDAGVEQSSPVTLTLTDVKVATLLKVVLDDLSTKAKLGYVIEDGIVRISTQATLPQPASAPASGPASKPASRPVTSKLAV